MQDTKKPPYYITDDERIVYKGEDAYLQRRVNGEWLTVVKQKTNRRTTNKATILGKA